MGGAPGFEAGVAAICVLFAGAIVTACSGGSSAPADVADAGTPDATIDAGVDACGAIGCGPAPTCKDGVKNGAETDVDCGGGICPRCAPGATCAVAGDCTANRCAGGVCDVPTCNDGVKDGDETDLDCGGSCLTKCGAAQGCGKAADCVSAVCTAGKCALATCTDGVRNGAETDVDCGGSCPSCATGKLCLTGADCATGLCQNRCVECILGTDCPKRVCEKNACVPPGPSPSCIGLAATCGAGANVDCCDAPTVTGGTFARSYDGTYFTDNTATATVSSFPLDHFEVTVARFRAYVAGYPANRPAVGSGANPANGADRGWDAAWTGNLAATQAQLLATLSQASCGGSTWTDAAGANEKLPINCLTWYEALAFCVWDRGRLPTEAEWNYAAAGGTDQRIYPWPNKTPEIAGTDALYSPAGIGPVGSLAAGTGKYGQQDLAGNVWEWVQDGYVTPYVTPCADCALLPTGATTRVLRGGSVNPAEPSTNLRASYRGFVDPANRYFDQGVRCARAK